MNRIDRLFAMLLVLQTRQVVRAEDLATQFEISQRTVYRDMAALSEMGVPLVAMPGEGYTLMPGYFLPPLVFSPEEAAALMLGARLLGLHALGRLPDDAERAITKIAHVLPSKSREQVARLSEIVRFFVERRGFDLDDPRLVALQRAIMEQRLVTLTYQGAQREGMTERTVEPHYLTYSDGSWYMSGYCRLRQAPRAFRLDRIVKYRVLHARFTPREFAPVTQATIEVRARFRLDLVQRVRERQHYGFVREEPATVETTRPGIVIVYAVHALHEIQSWLLGWGRGVEVLEPPELRAWLLAEAQAIVAMLERNC